MTKSHTDGKAGNWEKEWVGERERETERQTERQMSNRGLLSLEQEAGLRQTVHPSKLACTPPPTPSLTGRVRLSVSSPSPFAGLWHPFTLGSTGCTPPSALPLPFPSVRPGWAEGLKLQHSLCTLQAEKKQLLWYPGLSTSQPLTELSVCFPRSHHQKLLNLWILCEVLNRKSLSGTLPTQRTYCQSLKIVVPLRSELLDTVKAI